MDQATRGSSGGSGLNSTIAANPTASPSTTTYTVTVTSGAGCTSTDQVMVTVNPIPTADAGVDKTICNAGSSVSIGGSPTEPKWIKLLMEWRLWFKFSNCG